jgi:two-component system, NarL family, nitrate/nitrite response regulator NarL
MQGIRIRPVQVYLVAPPMVSWGLERLVQTAHPYMELLGTSCSIDASMGAIQKDPPDVVVAAVESNAELQQLTSLQTQCSAKLLVITGSQEIALMDRAVLAGARGVVRTSDPPAALIKAIEKVDAGELWIDRSATSRIFMEMARQKAAEGNDPEKTKIATLTSRERQTIAAVAGDASAPAKVIASRLCISEHTLRNHLTSIYSKLELTSRLDLYAYATRHRLTESQ